MITDVDTDTIEEKYNKLRLKNDKIDDILKDIRAKYETWKKIDGYNYSVSSFGRIRNDKTNIILKPQKTNTGYYQVNLYKNRKGKTHSIHRLVAIAFLPNPDNKAMVDHIDEIKTNNDIKNLRFATGSQNQYNQGKRKDNTTGRKGVSFNKPLLLKK